MTKASKFQDLNLGQQKAFALMFHCQDFLHDGFTINGFLAKFFEMHRDELGMYLQVVRVAMIS